MDKPQDQPPDTKGECKILKRWYHHNLARQPNPSRVDLSDISRDYAAMFQREDPSPLWRPIPIHIEPFQVEDGVTSDVEVKV